MTLFVAVEIGPEMAQAAARLIDELRRRVARLAPGARVSWVPESRLHVTVRFIGEVGAEGAEQVRAALRAPLDVPAFDLTLTGVGTFPDRRPPRVVWVGARAGGDRLVGVRQEVDMRLARLPGRPAEGPLRPHLTLGRVRRPAGLRAAGLVGGLEQAELGSLHVEAVTLFESRATPAGQAHLPLHRTALAGACASGPQS